MRSILLQLTAAFLLSPALLFAQSNDCSTATPLAVTANCASPVSGTTTGATQSIPGCTGTADDDVWYSFTATAASHKITVTPGAGMDPVVQVFSGTCGSLTSLVCRDIGFSGNPEIVNLTGLSIGTVYRIRVYHYAAGSGTGNFTICLTVGAPAPANNNCAGAVSLMVNTTCVNTAGTTEGATQSLAGCSGNADDDVWYSFVATNAQQTVTVTPTTANIDPVFQVFSGGCGTLTSELCIDQAFMDDPESSQVVGLTAGQTYYVRVYDYQAGSNGNFDICINGPATAAPTNDNPCAALQLPAVTSTCNYLEFTTVGATTTTGAGIPTPASCIGGSGAAIGGFGAGTRDVWFAITVPSTGNVYITSEPNIGAGAITDGVMALYSGTCSSMTQIQCSDDTPQYPGAGNDGLPLISATGLTPGATVYLRYWAFGTVNAGGAFGICVTTATNDNCANSLYICDINGYSASTSAAYTADRPCNMFGNNETNAGVDQPNGTNTGGIFGSGGSWGSGSPAIDVNINNNSWIRFTASATTAVLNVNVIDCWVGNYPSGGIQMQIFSSTGGCCNFTPVSEFKENSTNFTITANNLTIGNDYYLMVDGFAGDICNYTISAQSGVQFPNITPVGPICSGQSVVLTAPPGATSYDWMHNGSTSQAVNVTPPTTQSYSVEVTGLCGAKQTLTTTVTVNPIPAAPVVSNTLAICNGQTLNLAASFVAGGTYSWTGPNGFTSALQNPSIASVTAANAGVYTVTVTVNGCTSPGASTTVTINAIPSAPTAGSNSPVCAGQAINLTASSIASATYAWTGPSAFTSGVQNPVRNGAIAGFAGTYFVTATVNGCTSAQASVNVVVNPIPPAPVASSNSPVCSGTTVNLSASAVSGATAYNWTGPNSFTASVQNPSIPAAGTISSGIYSVTATVLGCTSAAATTTVVVNPTPATPAPAANSPVCQGSAISLSVPAVTGAIYAWTGPNGFNSALQNPSIPGATAVQAGTYNLVVTVNSCASGTGSAIVVVNTPATVNAGSDQPSCNGAPVALSGSFGGTAGSLTWTTSGTGAFDNTSSANAIYTPGAADIVAGTVTLTATTDDPAGPCPFVSDNLIITISSSPSAAFSYASPVYCQNNADPAPVFGAGSSGGSFSSTAGLSLNTTSGIIDLSASSPGNYTVSNAIAANGSCPGATATAPITITATPATPSATTDSPVCAGATLTLTTPAVTGATYNWSGPNGFSSTDQNPVIANATAATDGTYFVTITVDGCTSANGTAIVAVTPLPVVTIVNGASVAICPAETVTLTASGAATYEWSTLETTASIDVSPAVTTTYTVTGTTNGCSAGDQINVTINTPAALTGSPVAAPGNCDQPTGSLTGITVSGNGPFDYLWEDQSGNAVGITSDLTNVPAGDYTVQVTDANGCTTAFGPFTVLNAPTPAAPVLTTDNANPCDGGAFTITAAAIPGASYSWTGPNTFTSSSAGFTIDPVIQQNTGNYCVTATVNGCISAPACTTITVNIVPVTVLSAGANGGTACLFEPVTLTANGGTSYSWTGPDAFSQSGSSVTIIPSDEDQEGYYVVTVTNGMNCSITDSLFVTVNPLPVVVASTDVSTTGVYCQGAAIQLNVAGGGIYSWSGPDNFSSNQQNPVIDPAIPVNEGMYYVTVTNNDNCSATDSISVNIQQNATAGMPGSTELCPGSTLNLSASGGISYQWSGPNGFTATNDAIVIPNIQTAQTGDYVVYIIDADSCLHSDTISVSLGFSAGCLNIPELVTPDGDGHNDTWDIQGLNGFPDANVQVFNRWGNLVYTVSPYTQPWNGEANKGVSIDGDGGKVPFGTYYYLIQLNDDEGTEYKGYIELQF